MSFSPSNPDTSTVEVAAKKAKGGAERMRDAHDRGENYILIGDSVVPLQDLANPLTGISLAK